MDREGRGRLRVYCPSPLLSNITSKGSHYNEDNVFHYHLYQLSFPTRPIAILLAEIEMVSQMHFWVAVIHWNFYHRQVI